MSQLVTQSSAVPTRKMIAVIVSGAVVALAQTLMRTYAPEMPVTEMMAQLDLWIQAGVMIAFGYFTRDRA